MTYKTNIKFEPLPDKSGCTMTAIGEDGAIIGGPDFVVAPIGVPFDAWFKELVETTDELVKKIFGELENGYK